MMAAFAKALSRATATDVHVEAIQTIAIFSGVGLLLSFLAAMTFGFDLSPGFF